MKLERLNEILNGLGLSRRDLARRVPGLGHDGKEVSRWRKAPETVPARMEAWLEELWAARDDDAALEAVWARVPLPPGQEDAASEAEPLMDQDELVRVMEAVGFSGRDLRLAVSWIEHGEVYAWREGMEPIDPGVARWLRALERAQGDDEAVAKVLRRPPPPPLPGIERRSDHSGLRVEKQEGEE